MRIPAFKFACLSLLLAAPFCRAQTNAPVNPVLAFADRLYAEQDYYRAITEYKRFIFLNPTDPSVPVAERQIGLSYLNGDKPENAVQIFTDLADKYAGKEDGRTALLMVADAYARMERYREAIDALDRCQEQYPGDKRNDSLHVKAGWLLLRGGEPARASDRFRRCSGDSVCRDQAARLIEESAAYERLPRKAPLVAGALSAALPGAGQLYTGRPRDALIALAINGGLAWAAVEAFEKDQDFAGTMFALLDVAWYAGNIYNAVNNANKINRERSREFLDRVELKYGLALDAADGGAARPAISLRASF